MSITRSSQIARQENGKEYIGMKKGLKDPFILFVKKIESELEKCKNRNKENLRRKKVSLEWMNDKN